MAGRGVWALGAVTFAALLAQGCASSQIITDKGVRMYLAGDYIGARDYFIAKDRASPGDPYTQFNLGDSYLKLGSHDMALQYYRQVVFTGRRTEPRYILEQLGVRGDLADAACWHLRQLGEEYPPCREPW